MLLLFFRNKNKSYNEEETLENKLKGEIYYE